MTREKLNKEIERAIARTVTSTAKRQSLNGRIKDLVNKYIDEIIKEREYNTQLIEAKEKYSS